MKKLFLFLITLSLVFVAGCGRKNIVASSGSGVLLPPYVPAQSESVAQEKLASQKIFVSKIRSIYKSGGKMTCIASSKDGHSVAKGTFFVDGKMMRFDTESSVSSAIFPKATSLIKDGYVYTWNNQQKTGLKFVHDEAIDSEPDFSAMPFVFDCKDGIEKTGVFLLPNIKFTESSVAK